MRTGSDEVHAVAVAVMPQSNRDPRTWAAELTGTLVTDRADT